MQGKERGCRREERHREQQRDSQGEEGLPRGTTLQGCLISGQRARGRGGSEHGVKVILTALTFSVCRNDGENVELVHIAKMNPLLLLLCSSRELLRPQTAFEDT